MPVTLPDPNWTPQEKWLWEIMQQGKPADLNIRDEKGDLNPQDSTWPEERKLSSNFLVAILLDERWRSALTHKGVHIRGGWFAEEVDLSDAALDHSLTLEKCLFEVPVNLSGLKTTHSISLLGSNFTKKLNMNGLRVEGSLFMYKKANFAEVELVCAHIKGAVEMCGSTFNGMLNMNCMEVEGYLSMCADEQFAEVLVGEEIKMQRLIDPSNFKSEVVLRGGDIKGQVVMDESAFNGALDMSRMQVGSDLFMRDAIFSKEINSVFLRISGGLDIRGSRLASLDLSGAEVTGEFLLGQRQYLDTKIFSNNTTWMPPDVKLTLINTKVGALQDHPDAWPDKLDLEGFTYERLGGFERNESNDMFERGSGWYINNWLANQTPYSPQPYVQLADVIKKQGHKQMANEVLYAAKERERNDAPLRSLRRVSLYLGNFIGYGYRIRYAFRSVGIMILLGWFFLVLSGEGDKLKLATLEKPLFDQCRIDHRLFATCEFIETRLAEIFYSVDKLTPLLKLGIDAQKKNPIDGWVKYYFYLHGIIGYVLGALIAAWLSGLMKP